jgi:CRP-like cAMP-binding protein
MYKQLLKAISLYHQFTPTEVNFITEKFKHSTAKKKEIILASNNPCDKIYFVNKGIMRAYFINHKGEAITRIIASENCFLTNMISFNNLGSNTEIFECIEDTSFLYITKQDLLALFNFSIQMRISYCEILELNYALQTNHIHIIANSDTCTKIRYLKTNYSYLVGRVSDQILASFIGVSRETLVRNKTHLL